MAITTVAAYVPTDRKPQAFALSSPASLEINNQTSMRLVVFVSRTLRDVLYPGDHKVYTGLANLSAAPAWCLVQPDDIPDSGMLAGFLTITAYSSVNDALPSQGSYSPGTFTVPARTQQDNTVATRALGTLNARDFGANGDSFTDDRPALQAMLDVSRVMGGAFCYVPAGTYRVTATNHPNGGTNPAALVVGSGTRLMGDGPGATVIMLANTQPNLAHVITNWQQAVTYADAELSISELAVDGNAANQDTAGTVDLQMGIKFYGVNGGTFYNVEVRNVCGTNAGGAAAHGSPSGEGMHFDSNACSHLMYTLCRALSDGVQQTSTGFSANRANDVSYVNCWATGMLHGQGFTHWTCWAMRYTNCWAASCGNDGFHSEFTDGAMYTNCQSGGTTNANVTNPFGASTNLGSSVGFHLFNATNYHLVNCIGQHNTNYGVMIEAATGPGEIVGGSWNSNNYGIRLQDAASVTQTTIKNRPDCSGNTTSQIWYNGAVVNLTNFPASPAVPASTTPLVNPFPVDMFVYITAGTVTVVAVDATTVYTATPCGVLLRQGGSITLTYSVAPTWKWQACG